MPAAKMLADSTQSDAVLERKRRYHDKNDYPRKNKSHDSRSRRSRSAHKTSSSSRRSHSEKSTQREEEEEEEDNSDMDLSKPLKSINSYIKNRSEMLDQMFHCIKGNTLKRAIPDELQCMSHQELKQRCLAQLEVMSKKRILRILAGDDPANISSSGTEESGDDQENTNKKMSRSKQESRLVCSAAESRPADSTTSASIKRAKCGTNTNNNSSLVSPSSDSHLLPQSVSMPNLDNQTLSIQVAGYNLQTMASGVSTSCSKSNVTSPHCLHQSGQPSVINLSAEAGQLQLKPQISAELLPSYQNALELDCSDFPMNISPAQKQKANKASTLSSLQSHHLLPKTQQRNATSYTHPFTCSGSDYCVCGHCSTPAHLSSAAMTASLGVASTDTNANTHGSKMPEAAPGEAISTKEPVVPARILARTQMEILELEMRARAIKAMLHAASQCRPLQQQQQQQQPPPPPPPPPSSL